MNDFSIIVAVGQNGEIGRQGDLLWHLHDDMIYFKNTTKGHPVIMGRRTWESLQIKPLPKRENIVITRNKDFTFEGVTVINDVKDIMTLPDYDTEVFVIGGGTIYKALLPMCNKLYLTEVYADFPDADTYFPQINLQEWHLKEQSDIKTDEKSGLKFRFRVYERRK